MEIHTPAQSSLMGGTAVIASGHRLTIENAAEFSRSIQEGLAAAQTVVVDFEADVEMDITALQILCSACKTATAEGKCFSYRGSLPYALGNLVAAAGVQRNGLCRHSNDNACTWF